MRVEPLAPDSEASIDAERADRIRQLRQLFAEWTEEDSKLSDEEADRQERELYDYGDESGRLELHNSIGQSKLENPMAHGLERAIEDELRRPLPGRLGDAQARGFRDYFATARAVADSVAATRERRAEKVFEGLEEAGGTPITTAPGETRFRKLRPSGRQRRR